MPSHLRIIAEVAQGFEGKADYCDLYVHAAAKAGADAVKFQIVFADDIAEPGYRYYDLFKTLEMPVNTWRQIRDRARELQIEFFCDVLGVRAMDVAAELAPDGIKFHATNFFDRALIRRAFDVAERVFISLGGIYEHEIAQLIDELADWGKVDQAVLLCGFQAEPTPVEKSALNRLPAISARFPGTSIGYLDHTAGDGPDRVAVSAMAMALGADWIEKHLTLSRYLEIEDSHSALEPEEFADYVGAMRRLRTAFGDVAMELDADERSYRDKAVKKVLAARDLPAGTILSLQDVELLRSGRVEPFAGFHDPRVILGRKTRVEITAGTAIVAEHLV